MRDASEAKPTDPDRPFDERRPLSSTDRRPRGTSPWTQSDTYQKQNRNVVAAVRSSPSRRPAADLHLRKELTYLNDPFKLAEHVLETLKAGNDEKALALVRLSSRELANIVSWNHVIDYQMKQGKTSVAIDTYNEVSYTRLFLRQSITDNIQMKKRGVQPDSHTYLILLRGLSMHAHLSQSLGKALSLYHSMSSPKSKVSPTIMHANAMLRVCSRAQDIDSMWDIVSKLPERGPHAPNAWTYTTILNTVRMHALANPPSDETADSGARRREEAVVEGRQLWDVIIRRWRAGDVALDEELVNAMGRLLLIGARPRDWDDVLSLLQQSMNLARLIPRLGTAARAEDPNAPHIRAPATPVDMKNDAADTPAHKHDSPRPGAEFDPFHLANPPQHSRTKTSSTSRRTAHAYAIPGNSTLSLALEACLKTATLPAALDYWSLLTGPDTHGIHPDLDNAHMLLRVHRQARASAAAVSLVTDDFPRWRLAASPKTFRIALAACARDARNAAAALDAAGRLLDCAANRLPDPDVRSMCLYAELAARSGDSRLIARAMERLEGQLARVRSYLSLGGRGNGGKVAPADREDAALLGRAMVSCCDKVLELKPGRGGLEDEVERKRWTQKRSLTAGWITGMHRDEERRRKAAKAEGVARERERVRAGVVGKGVEKD